MLVQLVPKVVRGASNCVREQMMIFKCICGTADLEERGWERWALAFDTLRWGWVWRGLRWCGVHVWVSEGLPSPSCLVCPRGLEGGVRKWGTKSDDEIGLVYWTFRGLNANERIHSGFNYIWYNCEVLWCLQGRSGLISSNIQIRA